MSRRALPRMLSNGSAQFARGRELARSAAHAAGDVLHPLLVITHGLRRLAAAGRRKWAATPKDRRGPLLFLVSSLLLVVALIPYGPLLTGVVLLAAAAWTGRDRATRSAANAPGAPQLKRLTSLYEALVPYFSVPEDPSPLYAHGGEWNKAFGSYEFDEAGRISRLEIRYPAYFTDGEAASRARIEHLVHAKSGRGREYRFDWDEEGNQLTVSVLPPLPTHIAAQRFVTTPGETVLGFTDPTGVPRTLPVADGGGQRDVPPVVWRTGIRSTEPHLLAVGQPGSGTTTLLRSIALQALQHGDVLIVEGSGTGEYACLTGRRGVLAVECGLAGASASLEWAAHETERRLIAANRARQAGQPAPADTKRPLWVLLDRPSILGHLAAADGHRDPQSLLQVPLRHGRAANVTVVVADQFDSLDALSDAVRQHTRARVVLGPATPEQIESVLGVPPHTTPTTDMAPGRGYARLGAGPVHRLQVPATPDPYDDATSESHRKAVMQLLPERMGAAGDRTGAAVPGTAVGEPEPVGARAVVTEALPLVETAAGERTGDAVPVGASATATQVREARVEAPVEVGAVAAAAAATGTDAAGRAAEEAVPVATAAAQGGAGETATGNPGAHRALVARDTGHSGASGSAVAGSSTGAPVTGRPVSGSQVSHRASPEPAGESAVAEPVVADSTVADSAVAAAHVAEAAAAER
ncbi:hypothetical protein STSP_58600 [Streptomyces jeddahensis]|uniref:FtsK domain-containing protein n=1 Tax=Streptomyces jeddahensis TaxID=1716141 RepID=A0A177HIN1_9ACTN|nr:hypothetical protein [Streptomyces jeddahensis]OAH10822.1 hypothetical protein STSP_58600 [Streptomyces jeddahensis]